MTHASASSVYEFQADPGHLVDQSTRIDAAAGIIHSVAVITADVEAIGHPNLFTDATTLQQMRDCGSAMGQVQVKWNHGSGADAVCGYLTNFHIVGNKLRADWHLLATHPQREQALELASRMPKCIGLSAAFQGQPEQRRGRKFARCQKMCAVDVVARPAANPDGLLEAGPGLQVDMSRPDMSTPASSPQPRAVQFDGDQPIAEDLLTPAVMAALLDERFKPFEDRLTAIEEFHAGLEEGLTEFDDADDDADLADGDGAEGEEDGDDADGDGAEGEGAELSVREQLEILLAERDAAAAEEAELAALEQNFTELQARLEELSAERDALRVALDSASHTPAALSSPRIVEFSADASAGTEFQQHVAMLLSEGKTAAEAYQLAREEAGGALYTAHLAAQGIVQTA